MCSQPRQCSMTTDACFPLNWGTVHHSVTYALHFQHRQLPGLQCVHSQLYVSTCLNRYLKWRSPHLHTLQIIFLYHTATIIHIWILQRHTKPPNFSSHHEQTLLYILLPRYVLDCGEVSLWTTCPRNACLSMKCTQMIFNPFWICSKIL